MSDLGRGMEEVSEHPPSAMPHPRPEIDGGRP